MRNPVHQSLDGRFSIGRIISSVDLVIGLYHPTTSGGLTCDSYFNEDILGYNFFSRCGIIMKTFSLLHPDCGPSRDN